MEEREIWVKPYNKSELAKIYGRSSRTFYTYFKKIEYKVGKPNHGYRFAVSQVEKIFELLDLPEGTVVVKS